MNDSVHPSVRPSVCPSVCPSHLFHYVPTRHHITMKFSGLFTYDRSNVHSKELGQRSKVKVTEVKTQFSRFQTLTPVQIHIWWWNDAESLVLLRRGPIIVQCHLSNFKVTRLKKSMILSQIGVSGLKLQFDFTNGYGMMHKTWSGIWEVSYCVWRSSVKFQDHTGENRLFWPELSVSVW